MIDCLYFISQLRAVTSTYYTTRYCLSAHRSVLTRIRLVDVTA